MKIHDGSPRIEILGAVTKASLHVAFDKLTQNCRAEEFSQWDADQLKMYASRIQTMLDRKAAES